MSKISYGFRMRFIRIPLLTFVPSIFLVSQVRKARKPSIKQFWIWKGRNKDEGGDNMGIFDPDEVITEYSLKEAIEDGVLVEIFKNSWKELSGGKPIVGSINIYETVSKAQLLEIWKKFVSWKGQVFPKRSEEERLFSTEVNGMMVWVIEDSVCCTIMYPTDY